MNISYFSDNVIMNAAVFIFGILFLFLLFITVTYVISLFRRERTYPPFSPKISVIIPAYNEEKGIVACLDAIARSRYDRKLMQIIVVDDRSTDRTASHIKSFIAAHKDRDIVLLTGKHEGKSAALNRGVARARHEFIISLDADVIVGKDTIAALVRPMQDVTVGATNSIAGIGSAGRLIEHFQVVEYAMNNLIRVSFSKVFRNSIWFFGAMACYRKSALQRIGGFKKRTLTEDMDISLELFKAGYKIVTVTKAMIKTEAMPNLVQLFRQRMRWYYGALQSLSKNRVLVQKHRSPAVLFLFFNQFWWTAYSFVFFPLVAYQVYYWLPIGAMHIAAYIFRWFTLVGPFYVLYKIPEWGLNLLNIFGVMSGIISLILMIAALAWFRAKVSWKTIIAIFTYFPYTIIINAIIVVGVLRYRWSKTKYFKE